MGKNKNCRKIASIRRIEISNSPFLEEGQTYWQGRGTWPMSWIDHPERPRQSPSVALFRRRWTMAGQAVLRIHVSADNRYRLYLDGHPVGRGPELGSPERWYYESYELELSAGEHTMLAQTWWLGDLSSWAQMSIRPGFILAAEGDWKDILSTGLSTWDTMLCTGFEFPPIPKEFGWTAVGNRLKVDGSVFPWGFESGDKTGPWVPAQIISPAFLQKQRDSNRWWGLTSATLPPMLEQTRSAGILRHLSTRGEREPVRAADHLTSEGDIWQDFLDGKGDAVIPPYSTYRGIIDIGDYCCAYPVLTVSEGRGANVRIDWAESLYLKTSERIKGDRNEVEGRWFIGMGDEFLPDGGVRREFTTLWWEAGRYIQITVITAEEALRLNAFRFLETRYPLEMQGRWTCSDPQLLGVIPLSVRAMQMCSHETYMDCPYYEQLMYVGDTRLEVLSTFVLTRDDRLARKAIRTFADSRRLSGFTRSAFPSRSLQVIPPFSLWWVCMVHDIWMWRDTGGWMTEILPGVRGVMEAFRSLIRPDGLLDAPPEWNFVDWVPSWKNGIPPEADFSPSAVINLQCILSFLVKAELETACGESELAQRDLKAAEKLMLAVRQHFWNPARRLLADNVSQTLFSEHVQCLAILSGLLTPDEEQSLERGLEHPDGLAQTTIYFMHYLFEAWYRLGRGERILERMQLWYSLSESGLRTTIESPEPTRSDCHAWGAHPLYHCYASLLGIRPSAPGFQRVRISPSSGTLQHIEGELPHPDGIIRVELTRKKQTLHAEIELPGQLSGIFEWKGQRILLNPGRTDLIL